MAANEESLNSLEALANRLASEIIFAKPESDDGLIPAFALLGELIDATDEEPLLRGRAEEARAKVEEYLDAASPFDAELLSYMQSLVTWMPEWIQARRTGQGLPEWAAPGNEPGRAANHATGGSVLSSQAYDDEELLVFNLDENRELLVEFHAEALDHLDQIEAGLLALDDNPEDHDGIDALFRSFHTLKGNAGFLQLAPMQKLCHEVESLLDLARSDKLRLNGTIITAILNSRDAVQAMLEQVYAALEQNVEPEKVIPVKELIVEVARLVENPEADEESVLSVSEEESSSTDRSEDAVPRNEPVARAMDAVNSNVRHASTVRVNTDKLDLLMDVVGELVIVQGQILATATDHSGDEDQSSLERNIAQLTRITKDLQHTAMALRMVPIKPTFQKMERMVRDLAHRMGRKVAMDVQGEGTEVDRTVVEEISDPLVHMIRNALDHGIETEVERCAVGKNPTGNLALRAYHQGGGIVIELQDDGRGIDRDKVLKKAREKGIVGPDQALTEGEILGLIFAPGFSTAAEVTDVSGRGVGMDVVRRNIEHLRGDIEVQSVVGKGSTFRIRLPLTMAIIDGLVLRVGADQFVLPTTAVKIALRPVAKDLVRVQGKSEVLDHRGKLLPLVRLHERFQIKEAETDPTRGMVVLIEHSGRSSALLVDEMVKKQEVVIKNLGKYFGNIPGIAGGAILGDGNVALILDPPALVSAG